MPMPARAQRLARGWIVGLVATTVAAVSHSFAGGYQPGLLSFGSALIFAGMLGTFVIGRRPSLPRLIIAVGASQLAFHLLFSLLGSGGDASAPRPRFGMAGMAGMNPSPVSGPSAGPGAGPMTMGGTDHLNDPGMWLAHALAAVITILFLRRAELAVWNMLTRLGRVIATRLTVVLAPVPVGAVVRLPAIPAPVRGLVERLLISSASRRGPPLPAF